MTGDPIILCYHAVSDTWPDVGAVAPTALDRQIRHLLRRRYRPLTLAAALKAPASERAFVITFDDAFHSAIERGLPVLERLGVPATLFVPTDFATEAAPMTWSTLGQWVGTEHEPELRCMSWDDVRRLADAGWEVGSHTCSHPDLTAVDRERAMAELLRSRELCEAEVQRRCTSLAYPFGAYDSRVIALAREADYELAVTLGDRLLEPLGSASRFELPREGVYRSTGWPQFALTTSPLLRNLRNTRVYGGLNALFRRQVR